MSGNSSWANPAPAGLVALAVACFTFYAILTGKVAGTAAPLLGIWIIGGFVVQLVVGLIELMEGATTGGNIFLFFSAFFMLVGGLEFFVKTYSAKLTGIAPDTKIDGWAWMALWFVLWLWTPAYFRAPLVMTILVLCLDVAVPLVSLVDGGWLPKAQYAPIAGLFLLFSGICGIYMSSAIVLNTEYKKVVLPVGSPLSKPPVAKVEA